jgi:hypothetical protein
LPGRFFPCFFLPLASLRVADRPAFVAAPRPAVPTASDRALAAGPRVDRECLDPVPQLLDPGRLQPVDPTRALAVLTDETCGLEDGQVLGDGRAADRHALREQADRGRPTPEPVYDRAAGRVAEDVESAWVLFHGW